MAVQADGRLLAGGSFSNLDGVAQPRLARLNPDGSPDNTFSIQIDYFPWRIVPLSDGRIFIAGSFTNVNGTARPGVAIVKADGALDLSFNPPAPTNFTFISGGEPSPDGSVWVYGTFTNLGGFPRNHLARLLSDGSADPAFQSPFTATNTLSIAGVQPDGKVLVAGNFHAVAGLSMEGVARLNVDGSVDPSFQSGLSATNRITRAVLQPDGHLLAVVNSTSGFGISIRPLQLIRLNADGSLDATFQVGFGFPGFPWGGNVYALALQPDGKIVIAGSFLRVNGTPRSSVARIEPDGTLDYCFDLAFAPNSLALALAPAVDGTIFLGGAFTTIGGLPKAYLARLIPPPACDPGIIEFAVPSVLTSEDAPHAVIPVVRRGGADREQTVNFATRDGTATGGADYEAVSGTLRFAPGERSQFVSVPLRRDGVADGGEMFEVILSSPGGGAGLGARTNLTVTINDALPGTAGAPDTNFVVQLDGSVNAIVPLSDGRVFVAGAFTNVNGQPSPGLAKLQADGSLDTAFVRAQPLDGEILSLALQSDGRLLAAGRFRNVDGAWRPGLARFGPDGSLDVAFNPFASWPTNLTGYSVEMDQVIVLPDQSIICGGSVAAQDYGTEGALFRLSAAGEVDSAFSNRVPAGLRFSALAALADGNFLVGASGFGNSLVRFQADGTLDTSFHTPADLQAAYFNGSPGLLPDGRVMVAGLADAYTGLPDLPPIWRLNPNGSLDTGFSTSNAAPDLGQLYEVQRLAVDPDGRVVIAGYSSSTTDSGGLLARLYADGSLDYSFDSGAGLTGPSDSYAPIVNALVALPQGGWVVGGDFGSYDGFNQQHLVKILPQTLARPLLFQFAITNLTVSETNGPVTLEVWRRGDASGTASVTVRTQDGSATAGQDYAPLDATLDFAPGEWSKTVTVDVLNDRIVEGSEQFSVALTNSTGGFAIGQPSVVNISITSDDAGVEFIADSFHGVEEDGFVLAGVRWSGSLATGLKVQVNIVPQTGGSNDLLTTSVVVPYIRPLAGGETNWFRIGIADDAQHEPTRQFRLELVPNANVVPGPRSTAELLIDDLDFATAPARGVAGVVEAIANSPDGGVYLAGDFTGVHGVPRNRVARLLPDGEVDTAFDPGIGPDANVTALAVQADGKVLIAGGFQAVSGVPRASVARLNPDGSLDAGFDPGAGPTSTNGTVFIRALLAQDDGSVLVGGAFTHFDGHPRQLLARLDSDGSLDADFASPFLPAPPTYPLPRTSYTTVVQALAAQPDGKILAAGTLYLGGLPGVVSVVRLNSSGQIDAGFSKTVASVYPLAWSLAATSDGKTLVGGVEVANWWLLPPRPPGGTNWIAIRRLNTNGTLDAGFIVKNAPSINFNSSHIRNLLVQPDGRTVFVAAVYLSSTSRLGGSVLDRAVVGRLLPDGTWDDSFPLLTCALPLGQQPGPFWFNDPSNQSILIRLPDSEIPEEEELPVPTAFLAQQPNGVLVLAGAFDSVNGEPRRRLARLDPDGALRGRLELNLSSESSLQLNIPGEVEVPYFIDTSTDLKLWSPWLMNGHPWWQLELPLPTNEPIRFFRARSAE